MKNAKHKKQYTVLIIIIIACLLIFSVFRFRGIDMTGNGRMPSNACVAGSGYLCSGPSYSHATGNITLTLTQDTGANWTSATILFVPQGTNLSNGVPVISWVNGNTISGGLKNGTTTLVTLPASGPVEIGTQINGSVWAQYTTNIGGTVSYSEMSLFLTSKAK